MYTAKNGSVETVQSLLDRGADVNAVNTDKKSALMYACEKGHSAVVGLLLRAGADLLISDKVTLRTSSD